MSAPDRPINETPSERWFARFLAVLGNRLLAGIAFAIPLVVTYWIVSFGYGLVTGLSDPWLKAFGVDFPGAGFLITIAAFIGLGFMATHVIGRRVLDRFERFMLRIPVVGSIYSGAKQVLQTLQGVGTSPKPKRPVVRGGFRAGIDHGLCAHGAQPDHGPDHCRSIGESPRVRPDRGGGHENARLGRTHHARPAHLGRPGSGPERVPNRRLKF
jgi:hypothetical protein